MMELNESMLITIFRFALLLWFVLREYVFSEVLMLESLRKF